MLILNNEDVSKVLDMPRCLAALDSVFQEMATGDAVSMGRIDVYVPSGEQQAPFYRWAVMAGGNLRRPKLIHLPPATRVTPSERVVTSGHGGVFPPGLPVGLVALVSDSGIEVQLFTDYHQLEFVRIADFGLAGLVNTETLKNKFRGSASKGK